jgi:hypothetical protein
MKGMRVFRPNRIMHEDFARALMEARKSGVKILARECEVTPDSLEVAGPVPVELAAEKIFSHKQDKSTTKPIQHKEKHKKCPTSGKS